MPDPVSPGGVAPATVDNTSILLDRLCGYDVDDETGKTKLPIHGYVDALTANLSSWTDKPTDAEVASMFALSGQSFQRRKSNLSLVPVRWQITPAMIIGNDEQNVGSRGL